ncbi:DUF3576 domain-containing protein [Cereibacter changlensis]|uniref:DUF3576 domain-containing protein n=1 Tax=Cereibacter changlensis TaxID=402884 RepID=UPI0040349D5D
MTLNRLARAAIAGGLGLSLASCGGGGNPPVNATTYMSPGQMEELGPEEVQRLSQQGARKRSTVWDLFSNADDPNVTVEVNKYLWNASLEVLNFLPIESVDPFTGVIVTGYGRPPGGGRAYRATVYVQDPALDARSLKVALESQGGPVSAETQRAVEDAILSRARQLRIRDSKL